MENKNKSSFGKDFGVGCMAIIFILFMIFIVIPISVFVFKISFAVATIVALIIAGVVGVAFFGKIILFVKSKW